MTTATYDYHFNATSNSTTATLLAPKTTTTTTTKNHKKINSNIITTTTTPTPLSPLQHHNHLTITTQRIADSIDQRCSKIEAVANHCFTLLSFQIQHHTQTTHHNNHHRHLPLHRYTVRCRFGCNKIEAIANHYEHHASTSQVEGTTAPPMPELCCRGRVEREKRRQQFLMIRER